MDRGHCGSSRPVRQLAGTLYPTQPVSIDQYLMTNKQKRTNITTDKSILALFTVGGRTKTGLFHLEYSVVSELTLLPLVSEKQFGCEHE